MGRVIWVSDMTNGRNKGAAFERHVSSLIDEHLGIKVRRDLDQYREALHGDLIGLDGWIIECKRYKMANGGHHHADWWTQVEAAAVSLQAEPVLIYKYDRADIHCVIRLSVISSDFAGKPDTVTVSFSTWCMLVREQLARKMLPVDGDLNP